MSADLWAPSWSMSEVTQKTLLRFVLLLALRLRNSQSTLKASPALLDVGYLPPPWSSSISA